ncbi:MAG: hypothetical protein AB7D57_12920, partial [Desulfovibrionaceae bacterium]
ANFFKREVLKEFGAGQRGAFVQYGQNQNPESKAAATNATRPKTSREVEAATKTSPPATKKVSPPPPMPRELRGEPTEWFRAKYPTFKELHCALEDQLLAFGLRADEDWENLLMWLKDVAWHKMEGREVKNATQRFDEARGVYIAYVKNMEVMQDVMRYAFGIPS